MNAPHLNTGSDPAISPDQVRTFRQNAIANGYPLISVATARKNPLVPGWQHGERSEVLLDVRPDAMNTGMLLAGLRCIDCDVDDEQVVLEINEAIEPLLPLGALVRYRSNSPRFAMIYRAAEGQPAKRIQAGVKGKIEVLGHGQQAVVHGLHPTGAEITWLGDRGPHTVPYAQLPAVTEEQITKFLSACARILGEPTSAGASTPAAAAVGASNRPNVIQFPVTPTTRPEGWPDLSKFEKPAALRGLVMERAGDGLSNDDSPHWFDALPTDQMTAIVRACLDALDNRAEDPRERWLRALFAVADAERLGCPEARQLALEWSRRGASWTSEDDFDTAWNSAKPKPGGVGVGFLLKAAGDAGLDLSVWRDAAFFTRAQQTESTRPLTGAQQADASPPLTSAPLVAVATPVNSCRALPITDLPLIPPKRQWLHGTDAVRGAISVLVAPGGRAKSTWLIGCALACASGRPLLGAHVFGGPLRVLYVSTEDPTSEMALRIRAALEHHGLTNADLPGLYVIGADRWGLPLLRPNGSSAVLDPQGWAALTAELDQFRPEVLIIDPLINAMGGVNTNDNSAAALLMRQLATLAATRNMSVMLAHHASKGRDPMSAESAMGAASFINLARIGQSIEPLAEKDAVKLGVLPWEANSVFRVIGTKQNFSPPNADDRWFRLVSVKMPNEQPPIYPTGDPVAVVEPFCPTASAPAFPQGMVRDALLAVNGADPPLSPSKNSPERYATPVIAQAIAPHRRGQVSEILGKAVLDHLITSGMVFVAEVDVRRPGKGTDKRKGLVLTPAGHTAIQRGNHMAENNPPPQPPQSPANSWRDDAGGEPPGSPATPRESGGMRGGAHAPHSRGRRLQRRSRSPLCV